MAKLLTTTYSSMQLYAEATRHHKATLWLHSAGSSIRPWEVRWPLPRMAAPSDMAACQIRCITCSVQSKGAIVSVQKRLCLVASRLFKALTSAINCMFRHWLYMVIMQHIDTVISCCCITDMCSRNACQISQTPHSGCPASALCIWSPAPPCPT